MQNINQNNDDEFSLIEFAKDITPFYGTYRDYNRMVEDPSLGNIGMFALSAAGDIPLLGTAFKGISTIGKAAKAAKAAYNAERAVRAASRFGVARRARSRALAVARDRNLNAKIAARSFLKEAKKNTADGIGVNAAQEVLRYNPYYNTYLQIPVIQK